MVIYRISIPVTNEKFNIIFFDNFSQYRWV